MCNKAEPRGGEPGSETRNSTISNHSIKLFTLSEIYHATQALMAGRRDVPFEHRLDLAREFWNEIARLVPDRGLAKQRKVSAAELRRDYVHAHSLALAALARVGNSLFVDYPKDWRKKLGLLASLDWSRSNTNLWEGRAMTAGRLSKKSVNIALTASAIKKHLGIPLNEEENALETSFRGSRNGRAD